jgi:hypothetical protein
MSAAGAELQLAVRNLPEWVDEQYIHSVFAHTQSVTNIRFLPSRPPGAGQIAVMTLSSPAHAAWVLHLYNSAIPPGANFSLDMTWASQLQRQDPGVMLECSCLLC